MKYFDGNISELEREMIIKHNEKCNRCAEEFKVLSEALNTLEEFPEMDVPFGFETRVMEGIKKQGAYSTNPKIVALWLISVLGLMIFGWNMITFVAIPLIRESGVFITAQNIIAYGIDTVSEILSNLVVINSVLLGKILIIRNILLREYATAVTMIAIVFMGINLFLINKLRLQQD
jgi:hypothetical protein